LLLNHYINYCQTTILHLRTEMEGLAHELATAPTQTFLENLLVMMRHVIRQWEAELAWVRDVRRRRLAGRQDRTDVTDL
jgi:hypothetical protein